MCKIHFFFLPSGGKAYYHFPPACPFFFFFFLTAIQALRDQSPSWGRHSIWWDKLCFSFWIQNCSFAVSLNCCFKVLGDVPLITPTFIPHLLCYHPFIRPALFHYCFWANYSTLAELNCIYNSLGISEPEIIIRSNTSWISLWLVMCYVLMI